MTDQLHPAQLRARAALWSLRAALAALQQRAAEEDIAIAAEEMTAPSVLKSPTWGRRRALGGHADPVGGAIEANDTPAPARRNRWAELRAEEVGQLRNVAKHLPGLAGPLDRLQTAVPHMTDRMAEGTRILADRADDRIRRRLRMPYDRQLVPRVKCAGCDTTGLVMRLAPPLEDRVIECTTCGQAWPRSEVLREVPRKAAA
ncbi:hypothetical protein ACQPZJ_01655 [Actinoplanes sp. CA-054009]